MTAQPQPQPGAGSEPRFDFDALSQVLFAAVMSDTCDRLGLRHQSPDLDLTRYSGDERPLIGWARTAHTVAVDEIPDDPYSGEIAYCDGLRADEVAVLTVDSDAAAWGELFSAAAIGRGARGVIIDGSLRDVDRIRALNFPAYAKRTRPSDALGRVALADTDIEIDLGGVTCRSGDLIIADPDGVVVVPRAVATEAVTAALEKVAVENKALGLLTDGGKLADVWQRFGVL